MQFYPQEEKNYLKFAKETFWILNIRNKPTGNHLSFSSFLQTEVNTRSKTLQNQTCSTFYAFPLQKKKCRINNYFMKHS